ncbi:BON domain-containing protein [Limibacillus halophilus]|jgi:osmotically-inducible protein OsmY
MKSSVKRAGAALAALALLAGCSVEGAAIGGAAGVGIMASQERGFSQGISDQAIRIEINDGWLQYSEEMYRLLSLQVQEGRVLVSGVVPTQEMRLEAIRVAWMPDGVKEVINEVRVEGESGGVDTFAVDTWISTELKAKLIFDAEVSSINYSIETVHAVVYLMGVAQSPVELNRVIEHARNIAYVERVVSYVRLNEGEPSA